MDRYLKAGMNRKEAMKKVAGDRGMKKREVYQALLDQNDREDG
jgi:16S rRNA (cytidine1402-2'-O)-methyltransferase